MNLKADITKIVADVLDIDQSDVADDTDLEIDLGADSLDRTELAFYLEQHFNVDIPVHWHDSFISVNAIADIIAPILEAVHGSKT